MKTPLRILITLFSIAFFASVEAATVNEITLLPSYAGAGGSVAGVQGNFAPGYDSGSWTWNMAGADPKAEVYIDPASLFNGTVTVGDIASISYFTNKPTTPSNVDWSFYIYTQQTGVGDTGSFYHSRLISEPYLSPNGASYTPNAWTQWNSNTTTGLRVYDTARDGGIQGTPSDPFLGNAFNGAITYPTNGATVNYTGEAVKYFSLQTGTPWTAADAFNGLVDGLVITLKNGDEGIVNFEAVPEPSTWVMGAMITAALVAEGIRRSSRKSATAHQSA